MAILIREAQNTDAAALLTIYNDAVLHTTSVWTEEPRTLAAQAQWLEDKRATEKPVFVAEAQGAVVGFSSYGPFRAWPGYRYTVENSIYVERNSRGRGIGSLLIAPLIERACEQKLHAIMAGIEATNTVSLKLHAKHGFVQVGVLKEVGTKFGRWLDLAFLQLLL
jgi:phosphinothricin acetyltransferase